MRPRPTPARRSGFTLIELMVAIAAMALLALMSWRGLDGMSRAAAIQRERGDAVLVLQTALAQWSADLDAIASFAQTRPIDWDGRVLRLTRRGSDPLQPTAQVVAWAVRPDAEGTLRWQRWQSAPLASRAQWQQAWQRAQTWGQSGARDADGSAVAALVPVASWQLGSYSGGAWLAAIAIETTSGISTAPDGIRLQLELPPGPSLTGTLVRDWIRPAANPVVR